MNRRELIAASSLAGLNGFAALPAFAQTTTAQLKPGKPFAGTEINLLTVVAPQFKAHEAKLAEFEALTGIKVKYQYVPFGNTREKRSCLAGRLCASSTSQRNLELPECPAVS